MLEHIENRIKNITSEIQGKQQEIKRLADTIQMFNHEIAMMHGAISELLNMKNQLPQSIEGQDHDQANNEGAQ